MINGLPRESLVLDKVAKPKRVVSAFHQTSLPSSTVNQKNTDLLVRSDDTRENSNGVESSGTPVVLRKDRLVQEIENSLAEIEDHYSNTSKLEEERSVVEMERNSLVKDIEETIAEIKNHVLNSSDVAFEKDALQDECDGLRDQVDHLKTLLDNSVGLENSDASDNSSHELMQQNLALKADIEKLTLENEQLKGLGQNTNMADNTSNLLTRELELRHDENANLQKLLQMAEESEDNIAKELTNANSQKAEMQKLNESLKKENKQLKSLKEQLELDREDLEEEVDSLQKRLSKTGDQNGNVILLKESKEDLANAERKCALLEKEKSVLTKKVDQLEKEIQQLKEQREKMSENVSPKPTQNVLQLKSALEKLNKETSTLHESLEKAEEEITSLKEDLQKEREEKDKWKTSASEKGKKQKSKKVQGSEVSKTNDDHSSEVEAFKKEIDNLKSECECLSETVAKTANEKRQMAKEMEALNQEKTKHESKLVELKGMVEKLTQIQTEKEELERTHSNLRNLHKELVQRLEIANKNNTEKDEILQRTSSEKQSVEKLCKEQKDTIEKLKNDQAQSNKDLLSKDDEVKLMKRNLDEKIRELSASCEEEKQEKLKLHEEIQEMSARLKSSEGELNSVRQSQASKGSELQNLRFMVDEIQKELRLTQQNLREAEEARLLAEEKAEFTEKAKEDLEKSNAVFNDMAMEKSLELSRMKRTLEKKVEKLTKENNELQKKLGLDIPNSTKSQSPPRLSPVTVQMQKIPSLDVNLEHLSKPSQRQLNNGMQRQSLDQSTSSRQRAVNGPVSDKRLRRSSLDSDSAVDYQNRRNYEDDFVKPLHNVGVVNSVPSDYKVVASEAPSVHPKQQFTSSVVHVVSSPGGNQNSTAAREDSGFRRASYGNHWRDSERSREERRVEDQKMEEKERPSENTAKQDNSESAFQVVGYRKGGKVIHEHWV